MWNSNAPQYPPMQQNVGTSSNPLPNYGFPAVHPPQHHSHPTATPPAYFPGVVPGHQQLRHTQRPPMMIPVGQPLMQNAGSISSNYPPNNGFPAERSTMSQSHAPGYPPMQNTSTSTNYTPNNGFPAGAPPYATMQQNVGSNSSNYHPNYGFTVERSSMWNSPAPPYPPMQNVGTSSNHLPTNGFPTEHSTVWNSSAAPYPPMQNVGTSSIFSSNNGFPTAHLPQNLPPPPPVHFQGVAPVHQQIRHTQFPPMMIPTGQTPPMTPHQIGGNVQIPPPQWYPSHGPSQNPNSFVQKARSPPQTETSHVLFPRDVIAKFDFKRNIDHAEIRNLYTHNGRLEEKIAKLKLKNAALIAETTHLKSKESNVQPASGSQPIEQEAHAEPEQLLEKTLDTPISMEQPTEEILTEEPLGQIESMSTSTAQNKTAENSGDGDEIPARRSEGQIIIPQQSESENKDLEETAKSHVPVSNGIELVDSQQEGGTLEVFSATLPTAIEQVKPKETSPGTSQQTAPDENEEDPTNDDSESCEDQLLNETQECIQQSQEKTKETGAISETAAAPPKKVVPKKLTNKEKKQKRREKKEKEARKEAEDLRLMEEARQEAAESNAISEPFENALQIYKTVQTGVRSEWKRKDENRIALFPTMTQFQHQVVMYFAHHPDLKNVDRAASLVISRFLTDLKRDRDDEFVIRLRVLKKHCVDVIAEDVIMLSKLNESFPELDREVLFRDYLKEVSGTGRVTVSSDQSKIVSTDPEINAEHLRGYLEGCNNQRYNQQDCALQPLEAIIHCNVLKGEGWDVVTNQGWLRFQSQTLSKLADPRSHDLRALKYFEYLTNICSPIVALDISILQKTINNEIREGGERVVPSNIETYFEGLWFNSAFGYNPNQ